ncbi:unnamed protein product [Rhizophagus irregularis]|nr:unnamed protein product [Rhizophagus irregularis]
MVKILLKAATDNGPFHFILADFHGIIDKADRIFSILSASRLSSQYSSTTLSTTFTFSSSGQVKKKTLSITIKF